MIEGKVVLVLGAGSSSHLGFPLGWELKRDIVAMANGLSPLAIGTGLQRHPLFLEFVVAFNRSHLASIDDFLGKNPRYSDIGRMTIASVLMDYEARLVHRLRDANQESWYGFLWNQLAAGHSWDELTFKNLSIVTFNYDRTLEAFLMEAIQGSYGKTEKEAADKMQELTMLHAYGHLGSLIEGQPQFRAYGAGVTPEEVVRVSSWLKVIPETREDAPTFKQAQELLLKAKSICFLGFGFDRLNLKRLDSHRTCGFSHEGQNGRRTVFSCLGITHEQARAAQARCGIGYRGAQANGYPHHFIVGDCHKTLAETLILGR
jgi:hypothetical protein